MFSNGDQASLTAFQGVDGLRLAWQTIVSGGSAAYQHVVDAATGRILYRRSLTNYADGLVLDNYPGAAAGGVATQRSISRLGWLSSTTTLSGNNTHVYSDVDDSNDPTNADGFDEEIHPSGGTNWLYPLQPFNDPPLDTLYGCSASVPCTWDPRIGTFPDLTFDGSFSYEKNQNQDGTQLFYFINKYHDHLAARPIGFTEAAGNFQAENASKKGLGGDPVLGEALDGANTYGFGDPDPLHTDNANFATPPDGQSAADADVPLARPDDGLLPRAGRRPVPSCERRQRGGHRLPRVHPRSFQPARGRRARQLDARQHPGGRDGRGVERLVRDRLPGQRKALHRHRRGRGAPSSAPTSGAGSICSERSRWTARVGSTVPELPGRRRTTRVATRTATSARSSASRRYTRTARSGVRRSGISARRSARSVRRSGWSHGQWSSRRPIRRSSTCATRSFRPTSSAVGRTASTIWNVFAHRGMGYFAAATNGDDAQPVEDFSLPPGPSQPRRASFADR